MRPYADHDWHDRWVDDASTGDFDPDGMMPARLPGRRNHFFTNVAAPSCRDRSAVLGGPAEPHGERGGVPLSTPPRHVDPSTIDGVPWSRDAA